MTHYFITGIGTGVGKSFCAAGLLHGAPHYRAIKPVMSGYNEAQPHESDAGLLLQAMRKSASVASVQAISPWRYAAPLSPHLAAAEGRAIDTGALVAFCQQQMQAHSDLLIEGVGGLMVPLTDRYLVIDWMKALDIPVILVAGTYLGAINHTLLSVQALRQHQLALHAVIVSESDDSAGLEATAQSIQPFLPEAARLVQLPRQTSWKEAAPLLSVVL